VLHLQDLKLNEKLAGSGIEHGIAEILFKHSIQPTHPSHILKNTI